MCWRGEHGAEEDGYGACRRLESCVKKRMLLLSGKLTLAEEESKKRVNRGEEQ